MRIIYIAVVSILTTLLFQPASFGQQKAAELKITIAVGSEQWSRSTPAPVTITIENLSSEALEIKTINSFRLLSTRKVAVARKHEVFGDSFWSPVTLSSGTPTDLKITDQALLKKGVVVGRVPEETLHFEGK